MKKKSVRGKVMNCNVRSINCGSGIYGFGFIGALVYNLANATGFWSGVLGILKAIVWPALLVHKLLGI